MGSKSLVRTLARTTTVTAGLCRWCVEDTLATTVATGRFVATLRAAVASHLQGCKSLANRQQQYHHADEKRTNKQ